MKPKLHFFIKTSATVLLTFSLLFGNASANSILNTKTYSPLAGVEVRLLETVSNGEFFSYQVVKCDLSNPNLSLNSFYPMEGAGTLKGTKGIGTDNNAKVVMNADYFNRSTEKNKGSAVGYNAQNGSLISNALEEPAYSFSYQKGGQYSFDIFSNQIKIGFGGRVFEYVKTYNKYSSLEGVGIYDRSFGKESLGSHGTLVELVIENNVLTQIRRDMPPAEIPENGFVLAGLSDLTTLFDQVQVGDAVTLEILTTPNLPFVPDFTVGGGSLLVKEGKIVDKMSYPKSSDSFPAFGISQDGKTAWFITAVEQVGLTQKKMAELCLSEGAYYAFSLDGGGSTQCAVVDNTTGQLAYIHDLPDNYERPVANAIGITSHSTSKNPYGIMAEDFTVFSNIPKKISYSVYDENGDPLSAEENQVHFSSNNQQFTVENGFIKGYTPTRDTLTISYSGIQKECQVSVLSPALYAKKQTDGTYQVINQDGYLGTVTQEEFQRSSGITLTEVLPTPDRMAEEAGLPHSLSLYGGSEKGNTLFQRLLPQSVVKKLPEGLNPFEQTGFQHDFIELVTIDNSGGRIIRSDMTAWNQVTAALKTNKNNVIYVMKAPLSFQRTEEEDLFFRTLSEAAKNGKNILVLYRGEETALQKIRDGVRVMSLQKEQGTIQTFMDRSTSYLAISCNSDQMTYRIVSEKLFSK